MKRFALGLTITVLASCSQAIWQPPAEAYRHYGDRLRVYLGPLWGQPCGQWGSTSRLLAADCYRVGAPRRMRGVLQVGDFTDAHLFRNRSAVPRDGFWAEGGSIAVSDRYRLTRIDRKTDDKRRSAIDLSGPAPVYRLDFIGRETAPFASRQLRSVIVIDRVLAAERLPDPR